MAKMGSADPLPDEVREQIVRYLKNRVDNWQPSSGGGSYYDSAVKNLINVVLLENKL